MSATTDSISTFNLFDSDVAESLALTDSIFAVSPEAITEAESSINGTPHFVPKFNTEHFTTYPIDSLIANHSIVVGEAKLTTIATRIEPWQSGLEGSSRQNSEFGNSGILTLIVVLFVALSLNFKDCKKLFYRFFSEMSTNKKRENAFDERTNHETRLTILTMINNFVFGGICLYGLVGSHGNNFDAVADSGRFRLIMISCLIFVMYYIFQIGAYSVVGYTFTDKEGCRRWIRVFTASQSITGILMIVPAMMILFYPSIMTFSAGIAATLYLIARVAFIYKGFSIFYHNIFSSVYFILYLCTLEIIPLIFLLKITMIFV